MGKIRLLPLVCMSAGALLVLKSVAILGNGGYVLTGAAPVIAQENNTADSEVASAETGADGEQPATMEAGTPEMDAAAAAEAERLAEIERNGGKLIKPGSAERSEREVLGRLGERRAALNKRERELDLRESLLSAAEKKLEQRLAELKEIESRIGAAADAKEEEKSQEVGRLISMYEAMKPKDAARIFDRLDIAILEDVARKIKPRKMADIMGKMSPEAAERLTVALATRGKSKEKAPAVVDKPADSGSPMELPKIEGVPVSEQ